MSAYADSVTVYAVTVVARHITVLQLLLTTTSIGVIINCLAHAKQMVYVEAALSRAVIRIEPEGHDLLKDVHFRVAAAVPLMSQSSDEPPSDTNNTNTAHSEQQSSQVAARLLGRCNSTTPRYLSSASLSTPVNINRRNSFSTSSAAASAILNALPTRPMLVSDRFNQPRPRIVLSISPVQLALAERHVLLLASAATVCSSSAEHIITLLQPTEQTESCELKTDDAQPVEDVDSNTTQQPADTNDASADNDSGAAATTMELPDVPAVIVHLLVASASLTLITGNNSTQQGTSDAAIVSDKPLLCLAATGIKLSVDCEPHWGADSSSDGEVMTSHSAQFSIQDCSISDVRPECSPNRTMIIGAHDGTTSAVTTTSTKASQHQHQQAEQSQMLDLNIRYAPGMRECYLEARVSLVRVVVLPAPLLAVQQYAMAIMSQLEALTAVTTNDDSEDSKQSRDSSAAANSDNSAQNTATSTAAVPALPPLQVCVSVALVQCELWLPENPNCSINFRDQALVAACTLKASVDVDLDSIARTLSSLQSAATTAITVNTSDVSSNDTDETEQSPTTVPLSRVVLAADDCQLYTARMPIAAVTNADTTDAQATATTAARQLSDTQQQQQQQQQQSVGRTSLLRKAIVLSDSSLSSSQNTADATSPRMSSKAQQLQQQQRQQSISGARLYHIVWPFSCSLEHSLTTPTTSSTDGVSAAAAATAATALLHTVSVKADLIQARLFLDTRLPEAVYTQVVQPLLDGIAAMNQQTESDIPVETEPMVSPVPVTSTADGVTASGIVVNSDNSTGTITVATTAAATAVNSSSSSSSAQVSLVSQILACSSGSGTLVSGGLRMTVVNNLYRQSAPVANFRVFDVEGALRLSSDKHAAQNQGALGIVATLSFAGQIASDYYNPRILAWEPLIEPWGAKLQIELNGTGATTVRSNNLTHRDVLSVAITAPTVLNMNVTEGFIEAAASIANAHQQLTAQRSKANSHTAVATTATTAAVVTDTEVLSQYWIRNDTGTALTYSTDGVEVELHPGGEAALKFKLKQSTTSRSSLEHWLDSNGDSILTASDTTANTAAIGSSNSSNSPSSASMLLSPTISGTGSSTSRSVTLCMPAYSGDGSIWRTVQPVSAEREGSRVVTLTKSRAIGDISSSYADLMQQSPLSSPKQRSSKSIQHQQPQQQQQQQGGAVVRVIATVETRGGVKLLSIKSPAHITNNLRGVALHIALHTNQMKVGSSAQQSPTPSSGLASPTKRKALPLWDCIVPPMGSIVIPATIAAAASFQGAVYTVKPILQQQQQQTVNGSSSATSSRFRAVSFELPQQESDAGNKECGAHFKSLKFDAASDFTANISSSSSAMSSVVCMASVRRGSGGDIPTVNSTNITSQTAVVSVATGLQLAFLPPLTVTNLLAAPADLKLSQPEIHGVKSLDAPSSGSSSNKSSDAIANQLTCTLPVGCALQWLQCIPHVNAALSLYMHEYGDTVKPATIAAAAPPKYDANASTTDLQAKGLHTTTSSSAGASIDSKGWQWEASVRKGRNQKGVIAAVINSTVSLKDPAGAHIKVQAVDDNTLLSHDDGIAAGQSYEKHSHKTCNAVTSSKQQHVTATASSNGSANGTDITQQRTGNGSHNDSSNGTNTTVTATTDAAGLGLKDLLGAHAATQGLNGSVEHGNGQYGTGGTPQASSTDDNDDLAKLHPLMMSFTNAHDQACKARVRVVTASDDDSGYDSDSDNYKATTHWSQQLITVNHAAQLDAHDTQVIEVHAKAVKTSKQSLFGRILRRQQCSDTLDSTSNSTNALSAHTKPQVYTMGVSITTAPAAFKRTK
eukprot:18929-Heterococcus_DN1.PRE.1